MLDNEFPPLGGGTGIVNFHLLREFEQYDDELDIFEWGLSEKKEVGLGSSGVTDTRKTGVVDGGSAGGGTAGGTSAVGSGTPYTGPNFVSTPNIGAITPVYGDGQTGLTEVGIPTYEAGLGKQKTQFEKRAEQAAGLIKPQTLEEQQAAGEAPAFENRLYRNRFGMSTYIQFIKGPDGVMSPTTPIPQGYYEVKGFGAQQQTTGVAQGGMIQGYNEAGLVNPAMNFKPVKLFSETALITVCVQAALSRLCGNSFTPIPVRCGILRRGMCHLHSLGYRTTVDTDRSSQQISASLSVEGPALFALFPLGSL